LQDVEDVKVLEDVDEIKFTSTSPPFPFSESDNLPKPDYYVNALKRKLRDENGDFRFSLHFFNNFLDNVNMYKNNRSQYFERNKPVETKLEEANKKIRELENNIQPTKGE